MRGELEVVGDAVFDALVRSKSCDIMRLLRMFRHRPSHCDLSQIQGFRIGVYCFGSRILGLRCLVWVYCFGLRIPGLWCLVWVYCLGSRILGLRCLI